MDPDAKANVLHLVDEIQLWALGVENELNQMKKDKSDQTAAIVAYEIAYVYLRNILLNSIRTTHPRIAWFNIVGIIKVVYSYRESGM